MFLVPLGDPTPLIISKTTISIYSIESIVIFVRYYATERDLVSSAISILSTNSTRIRGAGDAAHRATAP